MTAMKLHALLYYAQAWSLVWDQRPLFSEPIEAWANGPAVRELYNRHAGQFQVTAQLIAGDPSKLDQDATDTIDVVLRYYGGHSSQWLRDLAVKERPWKCARRGVLIVERGSSEIAHASMAAYYRGLF